MHAGPHGQATTPKARAAIQASKEPALMVAERHGTGKQTVWKWRKRDSVEDRGRAPRRLRTTPAPAPAQEAVATALREILLVPLDDLLAVVREFPDPDASRSGLDRCLRRHGMGNLRDTEAEAPKPKHRASEAHGPGYLHVDAEYLPGMAGEDRRRRLFVAIDRATRRAFARVSAAKSAAGARRFPRDLGQACPVRVRAIPADDGKESADRLFGSRERGAGGGHEFDQPCGAPGIERRPARPRSPQANGMVERSDGRIEEVVQSHRFRSGEELGATPRRQVLPCNQELPRPALDGRTPPEATEDRHGTRPDLSGKRHCYLPGCDILPCR